MMSLNLNIALRTRGNLPRRPSLTLSKFCTRTSDLRKQILEHALHNVAHYGWTNEALVQGAVEAGYSGIATGLFTRVHTFSFSSLI